MPGASLPRAVARSCPGAFVQCDSDRGQRCSGGMSTPGTARRASQHSAVPLAPTPPFSPNWLHGGQCYAIRHPTRRRRLQAAAARSRCVGRSVSCQHLHAAAHRLSSGTYPGEAMGDKRTGACPLTEEMHTVGTLFKQDRGRGLTSGGEVFRQCAVTERSGFWDQTLTWLGMEVWVVEHLRFCAPS